MEINNDLLWLLWLYTGPVWALMLERDNAVKKWRDLMGPTDAKKAKTEAPNSIRAIYGTDITQNAVHGSDSNISAGIVYINHLFYRTINYSKNQKYQTTDREIGFFFDE